MGDLIELEVYHGTDFKVAEIIVAEQFKYKTSEYHWLGNGIYFYKDLSLAKWWTTKPSSRFGTTIIKPAIIECILNVDEEKVLDLRNLSEYIWFSTIYMEEFIPRIYDGNIKVDKDIATGRYNSTRLRCIFCDYLKYQYEISAIVGTFDLPDQTYLPKDYGEGFKEFNLKYIETQIVVFNTDIIKSKNIINI